MKKKLKIRTLPEIARALEVIHKARAIQMANPDSFDEADLCVVNAVHSMLHWAQSDDTQDAAHFENFIKGLDEGLKKAIVKTYKSAKAN